MRNRKKKIILYKCLPVNNKRGEIEKGEYDPHCFIIHVRSQNQLNINMYEQYLFSFFLIDRVHTLNMVQPVTK